MKKQTRLLALLLCMALLVGILPVSALAASNSPFTDVSASDWYADAVQYVYENGLMDGVGNNLFDPNGTTTRAMVVTVLHRLEGKPAAQGKSFSDVASGSWYADAVAWASENSIVNGYGNEKFGPTDPITREQMAAILYRYVIYKGYDDTISGNVSTFADGKRVSAYAVDAMNWAVGIGLISGVGNNTLAPTGNATRAQVATILMRFCKLYPGDGTVTVTFNTCGGSVVSAQKLTAGQAAKKPTTPTRTGYTFVGWYLKDAGSAFDFSIPVTANIILYAQWMEKPVSGTDTLYAFDEAHVAKEGGISFIDNIILAFTKPNLTTTQKNSIAATVNGSVVGSMTEVTDILQIRVATSTLDELEALADKVEAHSSVYTATIDLAELELNVGSYDYQNTDPWGGTWGIGKKDWWAEATNCYDAWEEFGSLRTDIKVGVVDNGFDTTHSDLSITFPNNYYESENELDLEDDGVTYSDHGTAVAGLIGAKNNDIGMCGVAYNAELVCADMSEFADRSSDLFYAYNAILHSGAKILNNSYCAKYFISEDYYYSDAYRENRDPNMDYATFVAEHAKLIAYTTIQWGLYTCNVIKRGWDPLFIQGAGNGVNNGGPGINARFSGLWAGISTTMASSTAKLFGMSGNELLSHILVVGGVQNKTTSGGNYVMTSYSNIGETVNICAPAGYHDIYTTAVGDGDYTEKFSGTSAAAPIVSGAAAFVWSINPSLTAPEVRDILLENHSVNAVSDDSHDPEWVYPMLDVYAAAEAAYATIKDSSVLITGQVINTNEHPLDNVVITMKDIATGETTTAVTDATGTYSIQLGTNVYSATFEKAGYVTYTATLDLTQFETGTNWIVEVNTITMTPAENNGQTITGIVIDSDTGQPVAGVEVTYVSETHYEERETVMTDESGRFTFTGKTVVDDWWMLSVENGEYTYLRSDNVTAEGYDTIDGFCGYLFVAKNDCMINGMVCDSSGNYIQGAWVYIESQNYDLTYYRSTDAAGLFYCWLLDGTYTISIYMNGYSSYETSITVSSGEIKNLDITLSKKLFT